MARIKLTYLVDFFRTDQAGTEKQLMILLKHLPKDRFLLNLISFQRSEFLEKLNDILPEVEVSILDAQSDISKSLPAVWKLYKILRQSKPDILHTFFPASNSLGVIIGRLSGIKKIISSRRDMGYWQTSKDLTMTRIANLWVKKIVANSSMVKKHVMNTERVSKDRISVIRNALVIDDSFEKVARGGNRKTPIVGIVANLNRPVKRVDIFIKAAFLVLKVNPEVKFWIIGDGYLRPDLEKIAMDLKIDHEIVFMGRREDVSDILGQIDIGIISSDSEGFSNAIMEYMEAGLPVVATDAGGNPELVKNGDNGFLVPPGNSEALSGAILKLIKDKEMASRMGNKGKAWIEHECGLEKMIEKSCDLYRGLWG
jgi:L-malate glycosyltransferase